MTNQLWLDEHNETQIVSLFDQRERELHNHYGFNSLMDS